MYRLLHNALLFYRKLKRKLVEYGFKLNQYDACVTNMETAGGQMTILWHVNDLKVMWKDGFEITKLLHYISKIYGGKIMAKQGGKGDYLGMNLDFTEAGVFQVDMVEYIEKIFVDFPEDIGAKVPTPHAYHLFTVRDEEDTTYLTEKQVQQFHHTVAQNFFLSYRARRDIQTSVAFLTTRVEVSNDDDRGKVKRVLKYLKGTLHLKLRLMVDDLSCT